MKKDKLKVRKKKEEPINALCYTRVGSIEQLSLEEQHRYFKEKMEIFRKGEKCDANCNGEEEKHIHYTASAGV